MLALLLFLDSPPSLSGGDIGNAKNFFYLNFFLSARNYKIIVQFATFSNQNPMLVFRNANEKMSIDRNFKERQLLSFPDAQKLLVRKVEESKVVRIGDWCLFKCLPCADYLFLYQVLPF